jgi:hypothetical protein
MLPIWDASIISGPTTSVVSASPRDCAVVAAVIAQGGKLYLGWDKGTGRPGPIYLQVHQPKGVSWRLTCAWKTLGVAAPLPAKPGQNGNVILPPIYGVGQTTALVTIVSMVFPRSGWGPAEAVLQVALQQENGRWKVLSVWPAWADRLRSAPTAQ